MIKVGSLFAGVGGFEKGIEDAFDGMAETVWQVEQNSFCQKVLKKHWPNATIYDDVRTVGKHNLEPVHILCGGFPCQSISVAGKMEGLENENKSGLWWEMHRIISELRPRIAILENVANILSVGGPDVVGSLAAIGYDCEWTVVRASDFGAPHHRARWYCVAYSSQIRQQKHTFFSKPTKWKASPMSEYHFGKNGIEREPTNGWKQFAIESQFCRKDDGISNRLDRIAALGNAIVPQCSEWVARQVLNSGLLDDLLEEQ
jgi:DNA (cytosine-5)-methyltransferase 1